MYYVYTNFFETVHKEYKIFVKVERILRKKFGPLKKIRQRLPMSGSIVVSLSGEFPTFVPYDEDNS